MLCCGSAEEKDDSKMYVRALKEYVGDENKSMKVKVGDIMEVLADDNEEWWQVMHLKSRKVGVVPRSHTVVDDGRPTNSKAWFNLSRREANKLLMRMGNGSGTYIIRPSSDKSNYVISVRNFHSETDSWVVKHYKVVVTSAGNFQLGGYICTMMDDVIQYCETRKALCSYLTTICPTKPPKISFDSLEINSNSVVVSIRLASGTFSEVHLGIWSRCVEVAVKSLRPGGKTVQNFVDEMKYMHTARHERVVALLATCVRNDPCLLVMEYMRNGNLAEFLRGDRGLFLKLKDQIRIMGEISEGMEHLGNMLIVHGNLRASSILVNSSRNVKITDFSLARQAQSGSYVNEGDIKSSVRWSAPEVLSRGVFSFKSDVWSFGILMHEIITYGDLPYSEMSDDEVKMAIQNNYRMPNPSQDGYTSCSNEIYSNMSQCLDTKPIRRPGFPQLHSIFDNWYIQ